MKLKFIKNINLPEHEYCTGCLACIDTCTHNALSVDYQFGLRYIKVQLDICVNCGLCEEACPVISSVKTNNIEDIKVFGGWSKNPEIRYHSASGGAATELSLSAINLGGIVIGATLLDNKVFHTTINTSLELYKLQNSKYIQSNTEGIYLKTRLLLKSGSPVVFTGTPCQLAGLYSFLRGKEYPNLVTVELVCHGVASDEALAYHLKKNNSAQIVSFRDKKEGLYASQRTTISLDGGLEKKIEKKEDLFYRIFAAGLSSRESCSTCQFSTIPRISDITVADFWGAPCSVEDSFKGVSLIITNNKKGLSFLKKTEGLHLFESTLKQCIGGNPNIYTGTKYIKFHPIVRYRKFFNRILPEHIKFSILTNRMPWKLIWGIYKVLTIININKDKRKFLKQYSLK